MASFCEEPSCLGLGPEWLECCQQEQSEKENNARFGNFVTDEELVELSKGFLPKNTSNSTSWALRNFKAWVKAKQPLVWRKSMSNLLQTSDGTLSPNRERLYFSESRVVLFLTLFLLIAFQPLGSETLARRLFTKRCHLPRKA